MNFRHFASILSVTAALAGCTAPDPESLSSPVEGIRPGEGSSLAFASIDPPDGLRNQWSLDWDDSPVSMVVDLEITQTGPNRYAHEGHADISVYNVGQGRVLTVLRLNNPGVDFQLVDGKARTSMLGVTDNRYRGIEVDGILSDGLRYEPHDCFATLGTCRYTSFIDGDEEESLILETTEEGGIWRTTARLDPEQHNGRDTIKWIRAYSIDENAVLIDSNRLDIEFGRPSTLTEIRRLN